MESISFGSNPSVIWKSAAEGRFVNYNIARLELMSPVQFCVMDKSFLLGDVYRIVYPAKYI